MNDINVREFKTPMLFRNGILEKYLTEIRKYPVLTINEETELFYKIKEGDEKAREKLINCNQRFVFAIAKRYCNNEKVMDLISEGNIGLIDAIDRYDPTKGIRFLSYAVWYIRRSIVYFLMNENVMIKKTNIHKSNGKVNILKNKYFCENGYMPSDEEIIDMMKSEFDINIVDKSDIFDINISSISDTYDADNEQTVEESKEFAFKTCSRNEYEKTSEDDYYKTIISGMVDKLYGREKQVIELAYGINGNKECTNSEIGQILGLTSERARQIKHIALSKLRELQVEEFC